MRRLGKLTFAVVALLVAVALGGFAARYLARRPPASRVFVNGIVLTMDAANTVAQAVAVRRDRIVAVGSNEDVRGFADEASVVVDLRGRTLLPGFIDAHGHFPGPGLAVIGVDLDSPPIGRLRSIEEAVDALRAKAATTPAGGWVLGFGYDDFGLAERRHFTRADLDRVSTDHPVFVWHISGHTAVVNTNALRLLGIDARTPDPAGGEIHRDPATGEPTGRLDETALTPARSRALAFSLLEGIRAARYAASNYAEHGVTTAQVGLADASMFTSMARLSNLGLVPQRLVVWPDEALGAKIVAGELVPADFENELFDVGAVKIVADGSIYIHTAYLTEPYATPDHGDTAYRGYPIHAREDLARLVKSFHAAGLQVAIHGNGDAAIDDILAAFAAAQEASPRPDARHVIVHAQMARLDQLDLMERLGVTPTFHVPHTYFFADRHRDVFLGPERTARISPLRSARERGVRFSVHSDAPVFPMDPLLAVWCAVNRISATGVEVGPEERISPMEALRSVTIDAAWQVFQEGNRGSIEPGKWADLVLLSENPLEHAATIRDIRVLETIVGGRTIFTASE